MSKSSKGTPIFMIDDSGEDAQDGVGVRMARSPSQESICEIGLLSRTSSEANVRGNFLSISGTGKNFDDDAPSISRVPSPIFDSSQKRPEEMWFEEGNEVIRGIVALSAKVGKRAKSFSTGDVNDVTKMTAAAAGLCRRCCSDLLLSDGGIFSGGSFLQEKLEPASRCYSTWVAVGDPSSQLPSPHAFLTSSVSPNQFTNPSFTPADLVRSVNKRVRQQYIKTRLVSTYKALERWPSSKDASSEGKNRGGRKDNQLLTVTATSATDLLAAAKKQHLITAKDVERKRGQPMTKYDRNMMIFNWLLQLEPSDEMENVKYV